MNNLAKEIIDEEVEEIFKIDNDIKAEWAVKKIIEERAEMQRYVNICQTMIDDYQLKLKKEQEKFEQKTSYLKGELAQYFTTVNSKKTKTQETYKLPSGTLKKKYQSPEYVKDEEVLVKWLKDSDLIGLIKVTESVRWEYLKRNLKIEGEKAVTEDGEIIEGIKVIERDPKFEVEI